MIGKTTITINGAERTLDFEPMCFLKYYEEVAEKDPLVHAGEIEISGKNRNEFCCVLIYAGMKAHHRMTKTTMEETFEQISEGVWEMPQKEVARVINFYSAFNAPEPGEVPAQLNGQAGRN